MKLLVDGERPLEASLIISANTISQLHRDICTAAAVCTGNNIKNNKNL